MQGQLLEVAAAIADGAPIDWTAFAGLSESSPELVERARLVERIAQAHASVPSVKSLSSSLFDTAQLRTLYPSRQPDGESGGPAPLPGPQVTWGTFSILERIGRGTFGDVYKAQDRRLNRQVALKLLRRKDRRESEVIEEGRLLARVRHPNVVTVYGAERIEGRVGLWMQFVDGPTLDAEVKKRGAFSPKEVVEAGVQLSQALQAVHGAGLLHRDIKAQNAMRDADGRVVLTDFGTGRDLSETEGGELAGTPMYLAPEVLEGASASVASDLYSLGVLLYYLATESFPVLARSLSDLREAHGRGEQVPARARRPKLPKRLAAVIDRATDPDPAKRYASAAVLERMLSASLRSRRRLLVWGSIAAAVLSMVIVTTARREAPTNTFRPSPVRDFVLVARFDNRTGDSTFDGGIEYELSRELSDSELMEVVPTERVLDALQLMKRPVDTVVNRTIGREICVRDGRVKALVTGSIDKTTSGYAVTIELVDPADGAVAASVTEQAGSPADVNPAITREARRVKELFALRRSQLKGTKPVQRVSTSSLEAFQLYNEALLISEFHEDRSSEALPINSRALAADPEFAAAWIQQAWLLRWTKPPGPESREAAGRAVDLAENSPEWERRFVRGAAGFLSGDYALAARELDAVVRLRPDFQPGLDFLVDSNETLGKPEAAAAAFKAIADQRPFDILANSRAAFTIVAERQTLEEARPYINRLNELLTPERSGDPGFYWAQWWLLMLPAYEAWRAEDMPRVLSIVDREASRLDRWPESERGKMHRAVGLVYGTLGQIHEAKVHLRLADDGALVWLADAYDDIPALRRELLRLPSGWEAYRFVKAGLLQEAREALQIDQGGTSQAVNDIGRGALALETGHPREAADVLRATLRIAPGADYQNACGLLATALNRLNRRKEAIAELERCAAVPAAFGGNFLATFSMRTELRLADEYRADGRIGDALPIEERLRRLLVYADADNPLLVRLNARAGSH